MSGADKRREGDPVVLLFYRPEEIEAIARALAEGRHRDPERPAPVADQRRRRGSPGR